MSPEYRNYMRQMLESTKELRDRIRQEKLAEKRKAFGPLMKDLRHIVADADYSVTRIPHLYSENSAKAWIKDHGRDKEGWHV
jgi:hypothetical protein